MNTDGIKIPGSKIIFNKIRLDQNLINNSKFLLKQDGSNINFPHNKEIGDETTRKSQSLLAQFSQSQEIPINAAFDQAVKLAKTKGDNSDALVGALASARMSALQATRQTSSSSEDKLIIFEKEPSFKFDLNFNKRGKIIETPEQKLAKQEKTRQLMDDWVEVTAPIRQLIIDKPSLEGILDDAITGGGLSLFVTK